MGSAAGHACQSGQLYTIYVEAGLVPALYFVCEDTMHIRTVLTVALLLPSIASAQARRPRIGGGRPEPAPLGPQPEPIARAQAIVQSRISIETYPMISRVN